MTGTARAGDVVRLTLPGQARYLRLARIVAAGLANELGADVDALDDVRLAVGEAGTLALAAGAEVIELTFDVSDGVLVVDGDARPAPVALERDHVALAEQILRVATADFELECGGAAVTFRMRFRA